MDSTRQGLRRGAPLDNRDLEHVETAIGRLRRSPGTFIGPGELAAEAGVGVAALRRLVRDHFHSTPGRLIAAARGAATRQLLLSRRPLDSIARAVGYPDQASFERAFRRYAGLSAAEFRRLRGAAEVEITLPRRFAAGAAFAHLCRDSRSRSERRTEGGAEVAVRLGGAPAVLALELTAGGRRLGVRIELAGTGRRRARPPATAAAEALELTRRLLGLTADPAPFERWVARRPELAALVDGRRGLRIPLARDPFDCLLWAIVGQQVNLAFAYTLRRVVFELAGEPAGRGLLAPPEPAAVARLSPADLTGRQFSRGKAEYLLDAARAVAAGELPLAAMAGWPATRIEAALLARRGLGPWSTHYVMMRGFGLADCLPVGDSGLAQGLVRFFGLAARPRGAEVVRLMEPFRPYRSFATAHLWKSLETEP